MPRKDSPTLPSISTRLTGLTGPDYWRSLEELSRGPDFVAYLEREFPDAASEWDDRSSRRHFLSLMGASLALAGLSGCRPRAEEKIVPYVRQPERIIPGKPLLFATAAPIGGFGAGVLVESHMGRPTKIEGNPEHPGSLGGTTAQMQASILSLYDPDRSQTVNFRRQIETWDSLLTALRPRVDQLGSTQGGGLRVLTGPITSPTLLGQLERLRTIYPEFKWHQYQSASSGAEQAGLELAFGQPLSAVYDFRRADVILALDADFLGTGPGQVRYARDFADRRNAAGYRDASRSHQMSRFYAVEATPTITGAKADHRLPVSPGDVERLAEAIANRLGVPVITTAVESDVVPPAWLDAVVDDLANYRPRPDGACLVVAGPWQPARVHALAHAINAHLGATGKSVRYTDPITPDLPVGAESLETLTSAMRAKEVELLVMLGVNPVYDAPSDLEFGPALSNVPLRIHQGLYEDETSLACDWHIPAAHYLETWGDIRGFDGTVTIQQPLIRPLYAGRSAQQVLAALLGEAGMTSRAIVHDHWKSARDAVDFEDAWQTWLHDGIVPGSAAPPVDVRLRADFAEAIGAPTGSTASRLTLVVRPDPSIDDGAFANNGWLQELPKPFTKLTWGNAAIVSPTTADALGIRNGDVVQLTQGNERLAIPTWILPGQADGVVTAHLGFGRSRVGRVADNVGGNVSRLRSTAAMWSQPIELAATGDRAELASTQHHFLLDGRDLIRSGTVAELDADPEHPAFMQSHHAGGNASLLPKIPYDGYKWGMVIDLNACNGCNACVVACQAENNIPVVGKEEVAKGREMHWLRIDTYFSDAPENPHVHFQPLPCMHCEQAPCEIVCPVAATTHSPSGINEMTYNRCVGTRYCSNNCPYKVRRFNFLEYTAQVEQLPILKMVQNPDVTVRARGVMEKCTYCVQRVNAARIEAEKEDRTIRDGEVTSACQAACPSRAIQFGDLNDADATVTRAHDSPLRYALLEELNTRPRTTYLAEVRNPHPALGRSNSHGQ